MSKSTSGSRGVDISLSKKLSWLLRHGALKEGLHIGADGFIDVTEILQHPSFGGKCTIGDIERIVEHNDKQRFSLRSHPDTGILQIRANQGHSLNVVTDLELIPILSSTDTPVVIHGTYFKNWRKIKAEGLSCMNRQHIHFSPGELDGIQFYKSSNSVILSSGDTRGYIAPKYFTKVIEIASGKELPLS